MERRGTLRGATFAARLLEDIAVTVESTSETEAVAHEADLPSKGQDEHASRGPAKPTAADATVAQSEYTCPMHPQIRQAGPGNCPICHMTLKLVAAATVPSKPAVTPPVQKPGVKATSDKDVEYTCPMHPQIRQKGPGNCPLCGMTLEPVIATAGTGESPELHNMTRRFWVALALTAPVFVLEMGGHIFDLHRFIGAR